MKHDLLTELGRAQAYAASEEGAAAVRLYEQARAAETAPGENGAVIYIKEAHGGFPSEDFLSGAISKLHDLAKNLRGENKKTLLGIIESLDDIAQCTFNSADYSRGELKKAITCLTTTGE